MADPFVHLHVASGYSLRHGAALPHVLVQRAAEAEMDTLALTDRDGVYGAVRFAKACLRAGIRPVLGVDLAVEPENTPSDVRSGTPGRAGSGRGGTSSGGTSSGATSSGATSSGAMAPPPTARRTPARGGAYRDAGLPRLTLLAGNRAGWGALCRLISATHLRGERGEPITTPELVGAHLSGGDVVMMLGPSSDVGRAVASRHDDLASALLRRWRRIQIHPPLLRYFA